MSISPRPLRLSGEWETTTKLLIGAAIATVLLSCGGKTAPSGPTTTTEITFAVGGAPNELEFWEKIALDFEKESKIHVNLVRQPTSTDQRRQGLMIPLKGGEGDPDVFLMDVAWIAQFAASHWLEPLDGATDSPANVFFEKVVNLADRYDGQLIALPVYVDAGMLYYRKDLLEGTGIANPPATWDELRTDALKVQVKERAKNPNFFGFVWQGAQYEGLICDFLEFAGSHNGGLSIENGKVKLATPENIAALTMMRDFIAKDRISPPNTFTEMREEEVRNSFQSGNALFERNWPYAYGLHEKDESPVKGKVGIAPLPHAGGPSVSTLGGWHIGISKSSDAKDAARAFVRYVTSFATQKRMAMELSWNPGRTDVYADPEILAKYPHFTALKAVFQNALPRPNLPYYSQISETIQKPINAVLAGRMEPDAGLKEAEAEAQKAVDMYQ